MASQQANRDVLGLNIDKRQYKERTMLRTWIQAVALVAVTSGAASAQAPLIKFEPTTVDVDGVGKVPAELGRFSVLEDRSKPQGRRIELVLARLRSTAATPGAPIVYLDGGPGGSGIGIARVPDYYRLFDAMRAAGDVILLSQRGTGFSAPRLACRGDGTPAPLDLFRSADRMAEVLGPRSVACAAELRAKGIDLSAYTTVASADDLEDLRLALGVPKISLFGFRYGTHLGLAAARRHPGSIERLILAGTEGPDHSQKLPPPSTCSWRGSTRSSRDPRRRQSQDWWRPRARYSKRCRPRRSRWRSSCQGRPPLRSSRSAPKACSTCCAAILATPTTPPT